MSNTQKIEQSIQLFKKKIKELEKKKAKAQQNEILEFSNFILSNINKNENFKKDLELAFKNLGEEALSYLQTICQNQHNTKQI